ncbi:MAG: undecaprenyl-phosphate galactose phosphotransferase WbaP [Spirochaetales bacterium]|nr:undecaprenyl-phosphate galactose phosphotransferase WbaP [Spirochaetales bacterium]
MSETDLHKYLKINYPRTSSFLSGLSLFFIDALFLIISIGLSFFIVNLFFKNDINFRSFINFSVYIPFILMLFICIGMYPGIMNPPTEELKKFFYSVLFGFSAIIATVLYSNSKDGKVAKFMIDDSEDFAVIIAFILAIFIASILLPAFREGFKHFFSLFKWWGVPAVIYTHKNSADFIITKLINKKYLGYHPAIIIDSGTEEPYEYKGIPVYPPRQDIFDIIKKYNIKQAIICDYRGEMSQIMSSYRYTTTISKNQNTFTSTQQLKDIDGIIGFASTHNLTFKTNVILKRLLDIVIILLFTPIVIPVVILISLLVKFTSKGPVFYAHTRIGKNGKEIKCWKFRSMCINSQEILEEILKNDPVRREEWEKDRKFIDDPRITKFGKFLRKTSLDELPQLWNIITGQMSLVGPRPVTEPELVKYGKYKDFVLSVPPGLTGMWQISGRSDTGYEERIIYDTYYIQNWSIWLDMWILIKTVWVVLIGKGAY